MEKEEPWKFLPGRVFQEDRTERGETNLVFSRYCGKTKPMWLELREEEEKNDKNRLEDEVKELLSIHSNWSSVRRV